MLLQEDKRNRQRKHRRISYIWIAAVALACCVLFAACDGGKEQGKNSVNSSEYSRGDEIEFPDVKL